MMSVRKTFKDENLFVPINEPEAGRRPWIEGMQPPSTSSAQQSLRRFCLELAFFTKCIPEYIDLAEYTVIYAGSSPGRHIPYIQKLFPKTHFHCYDPEIPMFSASEYIHIYRCCFTDSTARFWRQTHDNRRIIFIGDTRTPIWAGREYEGEIEFMNNQARWITILEPEWWLLRFRIPYDIVNAAVDFKYFGGHLLMQPFGKPLSMEVNLAGDISKIIAGCDAAIWNSGDLEKLMAFHNMDVRPDKMAFNNVCTDGEGPYSGPYANYLDQGYDVTYMLHVFLEYVKNPSSIAPISVLESEDMFLDFVFKTITPFTSLYMLSSTVKHPRRVPMRPPGRAAIFDPIVVPAPAQLIITQATAVCVPTIPASNTLEQSCQTTSPVEEEATPPPSVEVKKKQQQPPEVFKKKTPKVHQEEPFKVVVGRKHGSSAVKTK